MTANHLHILQHSLGVDKYGQGEQYRNRFVTDPKSDDGLICQTLCAEGLMKDHGPQSIADGMHCYTVTPKGIDAVALKSPVPPKLTRSQERYRRYLRIGECFKDFKAFLAWDGRPQP